VAGRSVISASGQRHQAIPEPRAVNDAAVAAYRLSAQAGNPLSERKLAGMFGRTSRRWARARIAEARRVPPSELTEDPAITTSSTRPRPATPAPISSCTTRSNPTQALHKRSPYVGSPGNGVTRYHTDSEYLRSSSAICSQRRLLQAHLGV